MVLPVGDWLTVRSRAPLIEVSVEETKFPPTVMLFFICKSWAWAAKVAVSSATIPERRRNVRVGINSTPWARRWDTHSAGINDQLSGFANSPDRRLAADACGMPPYF